MINLHTRDGWDDLKRTLDDRPDDVLRMCGIDIKRVRSGGGPYDDPRGGGRDNFGIWFKADGLSWKSFTTGERGRSLELIAYCHGWYHLENRGSAPAANFAIAQLGLGKISEQQLAADRAQASARRARAQRDTKTERDRKATAAFKLFRDAEDILIGTPAGVYLREARGIDVSAAPFIGPRGGSLVPGCLRLLRSHKYIRRDRNKQFVGEALAPCMIAGCVDRDGKIRAVHQTWLEPDGSGKASFAPAPDGKEQPSRKVFGDSMGLVIPLWRGDGHLSVKEACANGLLQTLVICEGVEDGLSAVLANPSHRVWAAISLSNIGNVAKRLPDCIDSVIVHRQNDWNKPEAVAAFDAAMVSLRATGRIVDEVGAAYGKDLNDTLRYAPEQAERSDAVSERRKDQVA